MEGFSDGVFAVAITVLVFDHAAAVHRGLFGYGLGVLAAAFWSALAGLVIYALLAVYYVFNNLPTPSAESRESPEDEAAGAGR
jgi:uncharacterized membrane protein